MILGVGIDVVEVARVRAAHRRFGRPFLQRLLRPAEVDYCLAHQSPALQAAARLAAKEAVAKAFGVGVGRQLGWQDIEVVREATGQPKVLLHGPGLRLLRRCRAAHVHLSLTHTAHYAAAVAIVERA